MDESDKSKAKTSDALHDKLHEILLNASAWTPAPRTLLDALNPSAVPLQSEASNFLYRQEEELRDLIVKDSRFPGDAAKLVWTDNGGSGFYPRFVAGPMIRRLLRSGSPDDAIRWLEKVLSTDAADGLSITALWGGPVERPIHLTADVRLVPIDDVPDSPHRRLLTDIRVRDSHLLTAFHFQRPSSALILDRRIDPFLRGAAETSGLDNQFIETREEIAEIVLALTIIGPRMVIEAPHWFTFNDPDLEDARFGIYRGGRLQEVLPRNPENLGTLPLDLTETPRVVQRYLALAGPTRRQVRIAIQRLRQSLFRHSMGDRAIELAIALEALMGDGQKTEMTHKIAVRSARLLGGSNEVRAMNFGIVKKAYDIRSKVVHGQQVDPSATETLLGRSVPVESVLDKTSILCAGLIQRVVQLGSIPKWQEFDIAEDIPSAKT